MSVSNEISDEIRDYGTIAHGKLFKFDIYGYFPMTSYVRHMLDGIKFILNAHNDLNTTVREIQSKKINDDLFKHTTNPAKTFVHPKENFLVP